MGNICSSGICSNDKKEMKSVATATDLDYTKIKVKVKKKLPTIYEHPE